MAKQHNYESFMQSMKGELIVLLENCLQDVPRNGQRLDNDCKQVRSSSVTPSKQILPRTLNVKSIQSDTLMSYQDEIVPESVSSDENDSVLCSDKIVPSAPTLNSTEPLLLDLPIPNTLDNSEVAKSSTIADDSLLCWQELAEPFIDVVNTPQNSFNSSVVDVDLTPPSSVASKRSLFEVDTSGEKSFILEFDMQPDETAEADTDKKVSVDNCIPDNKLCVEIACLEPTLSQLQVLYRRNEATPNSSRKHSLRPPSSLKQFVPFMFEQAEYMKKEREKTRTSNVFHSTPMPPNTDSVNVKRKTNYAKVDSGFHNKGQFKKKRIKLARKETANVRQIKLALKEKEAFQKKQLKLALKQKKETVKYRNKFENALNSINMRIRNQNSLWRMLPK